MSKRSPFPSPTKPKKRFWASLFYLTFEGRGAGRQLMMATENWLWSNNIHTIWLITGNDPNLRAYGFYLHLGWTPIGVETGWAFPR